MPDIFAQIILYYLYICNSRAKNLIKAILFYNSYKSFNSKDLWTAGILGNMDNMDNMLPFWQVVTSNIA